MMLNGFGESKNPCLGPSLREKAHSPCFSSLSIMLAEVFLCTVFVIEMLFIMLNLGQCFSVPIKCYHKTYLFLSTEVMGYIIF